MTVMFNGTDLAVGAQCQTWGDLVETLDGGLAPNGQILTNVRMDGVEEPAFRDPTLQRRPLTSFTRIEIESGAPEVLARQSIGDAADALAAMRVAGQEIAGQLRGFDLAAGLAGLEQFSQSLLMTLRVVSAAGLALRRDPDTSGDSLPTSQAVSAQLDTLVRELVDAQRHEDWLRLADVLEYDMDPVLAEWQRALDRVAAG